MVLQKRINAFPSLLILLFISCFLVFTSCESITGSDDNGDSDDEEQQEQQEEAKHPFAGGTGVADDPYEIETLTQLDSVRNYLNSDFILISDIDAGETENWNNGQGFNPIGEDTSSVEGVKFKGNFDGDGHTISNLAIDFVFDEKGDEYSIGLFGTIAGGRVENFTLEKISVNASITAGIDQNVIHTGGLAGIVEDESTVYNITISGNINTERKSSTGGLVGFNQGSISESSVDGEITSQGGAGGLVGNNYSEISGSTSSAVVSGREDVGGLIGVMREGKVVNSEASGKVTGEESVGGLVGSYLGDTIENSFAEGDVTGTEKVGGLVGATGDETSIENSVAVGNVDGERYIGGLIGATDSQNIRNTSAEGTVTASGKYVGGLIGLVVDGGSVAKSFAEGSVSGNKLVGGLVGSIEKGTVRQSYSTGDVNGDNLVGGLVGWNQNGGLVSESYANGMVTGKSTVGGLVGWNLNESSVKKSYAEGNVTGDFKTGGIVGYNSNNATVKQSFSVGEVVASSRDSQSGGIAGEFGEGELLKSYWDSETTLQDDAVGNTTGSGTINSVTGLTTSEMSGSSAESNMTNLDFENTWTITSESYPKLQWQED